MSNGSTGAPPARTPLSPEALDFAPGPPGTVEAGHPTGPQVRPSQSVVDAPVYGASSGTITQRLFGRVAFRKNSNSTVTYALSPLEVSMRSFRSELLISSLKSTLNSFEVIGTSA
jgi:hypothetical protein